MEKFKLKPSDFKELALHYNDEAKMAVASSIANRRLQQETPTRERYRQLKLKNTRLWKQNQMLLRVLEEIEDIANKAGRLRFQDSFQKLLKELDKIVEYEENYVEDEDES